MISASDFGAWDFCPRQVYFRRVLGIKPEKKEIMIKGTVKHQVFENIVKLYKEKANFKIEDVIEDVLSEYAEEFKNFGTDLKYFRKMLIWSFSMLIDKIHKNDFSVPHFCEQWIESEDLGLKARIDVIFNESGEWVVGDLKPKTSDFLGTQMQIGVGALLFEKQMNIKVDRIKIISHFNWAEKEIELTDQLREYILRTRDKIKEMIETKTIPPMCSNSNKCVHCDFWDSHCNPENERGSSREEKGKVSIWKRVFG